MERLVQSSFWHCAKKVLIASEMLWYHCERLVTQERLTLDREIRFKEKVSAGVCYGLDWSLFWKGMFDAQIKKAQAQLILLWMLEEGRPSISKGARIAQLVSYLVCCPAWCSVMGSILLWASGCGDFSLGVNMASDSIPPKFFRMRV